MTRCRVVGREDVTHAATDKCVYAPQHRQRGRHSAFAQLAEQINQNAVASASSRAFGDGLMGFEGE